MGALLALALAEFAPAQELVTSFNVTHPLSYQGRPLTRDSKGNYFAVIRSGTSVKIWKRPAAEGGWIDLGVVNDTPLSGREGECASIATDGGDRIHVVYYDGALPDLVHKSSSDGATFGGAHLIKADVTWKATGAGGPSLQIGQDNTLHVAFIDEVDERPHYAGSIDGGITWKSVKVADATDSNLRPTVTSLPGGRILLGYSAPGFRCRFSDDGGTTWSEMSPPTGGTMVNSRLAAHGNQVYVTVQKTTSPRAIQLNRCDGLKMDWGAWESLSSATGADASLIVASDQSPHVIWRHYPDDPRQIYRSNYSDGWKETAVTDANDYIVPYAYWQEFHRGNPSDNRVSFLAPNATTNRIYFIQLDGLSYASEGGGPGPQLQVATAALPAGRATMAYAASLSASGGSPPYAWSLSGGSLPAGLSLSGNSILGTPQAAVAATLRFRVADAAGDSAFRDLPLSIRPNRKPEVTSARTASGMQGILFTYVASASDSDGWTPAIRFEAFPAWSAAFGDTLKGTPPAAGAYSFKVIASDASLSDTETVALTVASSNLPPVVDSVSIQKPSLAEGDSTTFRAWAWDPNGDSLAYVWKLGTAEVSRGGSVFTYKAGYLASGKRDFTVQAGDGKGGEGIFNFSVQVANTSVPPMVTTPPGVLNPNSVLEWGWDRPRDPDLDSLSMRFKIAVHGSATSTTPLFVRDSVADRKAMLSSIGPAPSKTQDLWVRVEAFDFKGYRTGFGGVKQFRFEPATTLVSLPSEPPQTLSFERESVPSTGETWLKVGVPGKSGSGKKVRVEISIFDAAGRRVEGLFDAYLPPGHYRIRLSRTAPGPVSGGKRRIGRIRAEGFVKALPLESAF